MMSGCSVTFSALCMLASSPSRGDVSVAAGMATSNISTPPGFSALRPQVGGVDRGQPSCARLMRIVVVDAV